MVKAIVYESKAGHTLKYAEMLSKKLNIPFYWVNESLEKLNSNEKIIFLSWICAGKIKEKNKIDNKYDIVCYGAVGAYPYSDEYLKELKVANNIDKPLFYLRGGIDYSKLNKFQKLLVKLVGKTMKNSDEKTQIMFKQGYDFVKKDNLEEIVKYIQIK
ncbi:putative uncharacterized protein [Firmicutes bacterium CAG:822]|nr:putative uncharacterized protein [Firmicutes bacterium CAG:822]